MLTRNKIFAATLAALLSVMTAGSLQAQSATTVICKDGKTRSTRVACANHGGVARVVVRHEPTVATIVDRRAEAARAAETPRASERAIERANAHSAVRRSVTLYNTNPRGAIALCQDGLYSHVASRRDACLHHDGVARWM